MFGSLIRSFFARFWKGKTTVTEKILSTSEISFHGKKRSYHKDIIESWPQATLSHRIEPREVLDSWRGVFRTRPIPMHCLCTLCSFPHWAFCWYEGPAAPSDLPTRNATFFKCQTPAKRFCASVQLFAMRRTRWGALNLGECDKRVSPLVSDLHTLLEIIYNIPFLYCNVFFIFYLFSSHIKISFFIWESPL